LQTLCAPCIRTVLAEQQIHLLAFRDLGRPTMGYREACSGSKYRAKLLPSERGGNVWLRNNGRGSRYPDHH
jgi:hypothetical protein